MVVELVLVLISSLWLMEPSAATPPMAKPGCNDSCGGVTIPYPFGFGAEQCYLEQGFEITCKESANKPPKPFLTRFDLEVLSISLDSQNVTVNVPVVRICRGNPWRSANLAGSPFRFSDSNSFIVMGCGNALLTNQSGAIVGGCTATCNSSIIIDTEGCYGIDCCQVSIPSGLTIFNINTTTEECTSSFLWYSDHSPIPGDFSNSSTPVLLDWMITSPDIFPRERWSSTSTDANGSVTSYGYSCPSYYEGNPYISNGCEVVPACAGCIRSCAANYSTYTDIGKGRYRADQYYCSKEKISLKIVIGNTLMYHVSSVYLCASFHGQENCIMHDPHPKSMWLFTKQDHHYCCHLASSMYARCELMVVSSSPLQLLHDLALNRAGNIKRYPQAIRFRIYYIYTKTEEKKPPCATC